MGCRAVLRGEHARIPCQLEPSMSDSKLEQVGVLTSKKSELDWKGVKGFDR